MTRSFQEIIAGEIVPHLESLFARVTTEKDQIVLDGVAAFERDVFVPGKVINSFSYLLVNSGLDPDRFNRRLAEFKEIVAFTKDYELKTWGIFYYLTGLDRLRREGLLEKVTRPEWLEQLRQKLDWRKFVNESDLSLIGLPTNYYGCAFGVARLRALLGWEEERPAEVLFAKLMEHVESFSGEYGFADETPGEGRFDRYSVLLPAELCTRLVDTGMPVPGRLREMLRRSCDIHLMLASEAGHGFSYGRTIGAYGDTSTLEVLSIAAYLGILTESERDLAYAFCTRVAEKFVRFWIDPRMGSVNLWEGGRMADPYMGKNRILGENLSLCYQLIHSANFWAKAGYASRTPQEDWFGLTAGLPKHHFTRFCRGDYDRALTIVRDGDHVISLPLVSGGTHQYKHTPYFPTPYENLMLSGSPSQHRSHLVPRVKLADGAIFMPLSYIRGIEAGEEDGAYRVRYRQDGYCRIGGEQPERDSRLASEVVYTFRPGEIVRRETIRPEGPLELSGIQLQLACYSGDPEQDGLAVRFGRGNLYEAALTGLDDCQVEQVVGDPTYRTPHGALQYRVIWRSGAMTLAEPLTLEWVLKYR